MLSKTKCPTAQVELAIGPFWSQNMTLTFDKQLWILCAVHRLKEANISARYIVNSLINGLVTSWTSKSGTEGRT